MARDTEYQSTTDMRDRFRSKTLVSDFFKVLDPKRVESGSSKDHHTYGVAELDRLLEYWGQPAEAVLGLDSNEKPVRAFYIKGESERKRCSQRIVDPGACRREYAGFRQPQAEYFARGTFTDPSRVSPKSPFNLFLTWHLQSLYAEQYPCMTELTRIAATLPIGSASVERSFSQMKLIKNRLRSSLTNENLHWLVLIAMEGPDLLPADMIEEVIDLCKAQGMSVLV